MIQRSNHHFCLHAGGAELALADLKDLPTPAAENRWHPVPHHAYATAVRESLVNSGYRISAEHYATAKDHTRFFGMMFVPGMDEQDREFEWAIGLRNSHDRTVSCRMAVGTHVFVCDNLAFSGDIEVTRKNTTHALSNMPMLVNRAVGQLQEIMTKDVQRVERYKTLELTDVKAHDIMVRAVKGQCVPAVALPQVIQEWEGTVHEEFKPRNLWSLFNAFTAARRLKSIESQVQGGERLHGFFDGLVLSS